MLYALCCFKRPFGVSGCALLQPSSREQTGSSKPACNCKLPAFFGLFWTYQLCQHTALGRQQGHTGPVCGEPFELLGGSLGC